MAKVHAIAQAAASRWKWLVSCWALRKATHDTITSLSSQWCDERDRAHLLAIEVASLKSKLADQETQLGIARNGNKALWLFIHRAHRLNMKFDENSIYEMLKKADKK